jgi:CPA2 family monovalent cation:H+ antiporter-2
VIFGDSSDEDVLESCGLANASALVVSFADPTVSLSIVRAVRRLRADVPVLVRTADDGGIDQLRAVGATEVVPETFEASLMLAAHTLMALNMSIKNVVGVMDQIRRARYATLRSVLLPYTPGGAVEGDEGQEGISSIVIPPLAWSVGKTLQEVRARGAAVAFTAIRRRGITGREPDEATVLRGGDVLVVYGQPEAIEHAEAILLAG